MGDSIAAAWRKSRSLAVARDVALDVTGRWGAGGMGRPRWLLLGPLTAVLASAAAADVAHAQGPFDLAGRALTAALMLALFLNVAAKRLRDLRLGGWAAAIPLHGGLGVAHALETPAGPLVIAWAVVMFLLPGEAARAARGLRPPSETGD